MVRKFIQIDENGIVTGGCEIESGAVKGDPSTRGLIEVDASVDLSDVMFRYYDRQTGQFGEKPLHAPARVIGLDEFMDRIEMGEDVAIRLLAGSEKLDHVDRATAAAYMARLFARSRVNLDSPAVVEAFTFFKRIGVPDVWPDEETADARIAKIRE